MADEIEIEIMEDGADVAPTTVVEAADKLKRGIEERSATEIAATAAAAASETRLRDETTARKRAQEDAAAANTRAAEAERAQLESRYDAIVNGIAAAEQRGEQLATAKAKLLEEGNFLEAGKLDLQIAEVGGNLANLKAGKIEAEDAKKKATDDAAKRTAEPTRSQPSVTEAEDAWLATQDAVNATWIRANRARFFTDKEFQRKASLYSQVAIDEGIKTTDPRYIPFIESKLGMREAEPAPTTEAGKTTERSGADGGGRAPVTAAPRPAAPPSRSTPAMNGAVRTKVTLTPEEVAIARTTMTPEIIGKNPDGSPRDPIAVFAARKLELEREGRVFTNGGR